MQLRAKANGNIIEVDDYEQSRELLATGLFDEIDEGEAVTEPPAPPAPPPAHEPKSRRRRKGSR